ncbi:hypothetical protein CHL67_09525 [Prosthecochloris sp. GSB1]|uniref:DUF1499 domain-containing protein n=1 Tax=Prosthecochloris sp. GSB1 TaxID=281093 RepID=UPI000B8CDF49|nr:DUF1499 domain-containing protein [Prosthecochloris sp. GSB1]ASQ91122.1 hypothetical protein CHL67_09525 [Prosthecochloris sp. GSB1]
MNIINDALKTVTGMFSGLWPEPESRPRLVDGRLRPCPTTPNCVCSEHGAVEPIVFQGMLADEALERLHRIIDEMGGVVQGDDGDYLWSTFTVPVFGFVDDVEFRLDREAGVIHVRSASRLGFSDLGVNRGRVEELRGRFRSSA